MMTILSSLGSSSALYSSIPIISSRSLTLTLACDDSGVSLNSEGTPERVYIWNVVDCGHCEVEKGHSMVTHHHNISGPHCNTKNLCVHKTFAKFRERLRFAKKIHDPKDLNRNWYCTDYLKFTKSFLMRKWPLFTICKSLMLGKCLVLHERRCPHRKIP